MLMGSVTDEPEQLLLLFLLQSYPKPAPRASRWRKDNRPGLPSLKSRMPFADLSRFEANPLVQDFGNLLKVSDMCRFVEAKVGVTE